jgi:hypothetical protein
MSMTRLAVRSPFVFAAGGGLFIDINDHMIAKYGAKTTTKGFSFRSKGVYTVKILLTDNIWSLR